MNRQNTKLYKIYKVLGPKQACDKYFMTSVGDITQVQRREASRVGILKRNLVKDGKDLVFPDRKRKDKRDRKMLYNQEAASW